MNVAGQVLNEALLAFSLIVAPLLFFGGHWGVLEFERSRCALQTFIQARERLIKEGIPIVETSKCEAMVEQKVALKSLESLDFESISLRGKELERKALQLWEPLWSSLPSRLDAPSGTKSSTSGPLPKDKSLSTDASEQPDSD